MSDRGTSTSHRPAFAWQSGYGGGRPRDERTPMDVRFWEKVDTSGECWLWLGGCNSDGYGRIALPGHRKGSIPAHRVFAQGVLLWPRRGNR